MFVVGLYSNGQLKVLHTTLGLMDLVGLGFTVMLAYPPTIADRKYPFPFLVTASGLGVNPRDMMRYSVLACFG